MKKLLVVAGIYLDDSNSGITRKVKSYYQAFQRKYDTYLLAYHGKQICLMSKEETFFYDNKIPYKKAGLVHRLGKVVEEYPFDYLFIRRTACNPLLLRVLKNVKNHNVDKIIWEIPTYPYDAEDFSKVERIENNIDKLYRNRLNKSIDRIATYTPDDIIFNIPCISVKNGICINDIQERRPHDLSDEVHMIAVAVLHDWHGYDRLIEGIHNYYHQGGQKNIVFHVIGDGPVRGKYEELIQKYGLQEHVIMHGFQHGEAVDHIYNQCDIAVESLAWHRINVKAGSTLKVREYLAKGMPILASSPMDVIPKEWKYACYAPIDDSPVNMNAVIEFNKQIYHTDETQEDIISNIRRFAVDNCDVQSTLKPIMDFWDGR